MLALVRQHGNLVCLIHPWMHSSATNLHSPPPCLSHIKVAILHFLCMVVEEVSIGLWNGKYDGRNNIGWTRHEPQQHNGTEIVPNCNIVGLLWPPCVPILPVVVGQPVGEWLSYLTWTHKVGGLIDWWGHDKTWTAVGPLSIAPGACLLLSLINCKSLWIKVSAKWHVLYVVFHGI